MSDEFAPRRYSQAGPAMFFRPWFRVCGTRSASRPHPNRAGLNRLAPKGDPFFLHYLDVLPPDGGDRFTQSECPLGQL
jgi:hypothetical protein